MYVSTLCNPYSNFANVDTTHLTAVSPGQADSDGYTGVTPTLCGKVDGLVALIFGDHSVLAKPVRRWAQTPKMRWQFQSLEWAETS